MFSQGWDGGYGVVFKLRAWDIYITKFIEIYWTLASLGTVGLVYYQLESEGGYVYFQLGRGGSGYIQVNGNLSEMDYSGMGCLLFA